VDVESAVAVGPLLLELREADRDASAADAALLAVARTHGAKLVSGDGCFKGRKDVASY
jgi:hypothetical protein